MGTTLRQIAAYAGVSVTTVSLVLNDKGSISPETRQRVRNAVVATGYRRRQRNNARLGLVGSPQGSLQVCLYQAAAEFGCTLQHLPWTSELDGLPSVAGSLRIDALIVFGGSWKPGFLAQVVDAYPAVLLGCWAADPHGDAVWVDNEQAMAHAAMHLAERGHEQIGLLNGPGHSRTSGEKRLGFETAVAGAGVEGTIVDAADFTLDAALTAATRLLGDNPALTGVVAAEDVFGVALYRACGDLGLAIPADISLIVFRDHPFLAACSPPITVMALPEMDIARETVRYAVQQLNAPGTAGRRLLFRPRLVERASVRVRESQGA